MAADTGALPDASQGYPADINNDPMMYEAKRISLSNAGITQHDDGKFYDEDNPNQPLLNANGQPMNMSEALAYAKEKKTKNQQPNPNGSETPQPASGSPENKGQIPTA